MNNILNDVVEAFLKYKYYACCIPASILLHELIPKSTLLKGFINANNRVSGWHVWVDVDGLILDAGTAINSKYHNIKAICTLSETPERRRLDLDTPEELRINKQNEMLFKLYQESPNKYWHLFQLLDPEKYNIVITIYNTLSKRDTKTNFEKQKVNGICACKSNKKYKKCCKPLYDTFNNL